MSDLKVQALDFATRGGGTHAEVVARANAYHGFLSGAAAGSGAATAGKTAAPAANGAAKPQATTKPAQTTKPAPAQTTKPAPAANTKANAAAGAPVTDKRVSPKGTPASAVVDALRKVKLAPQLGGEVVKRLLNEAGATNIASLKPDMFEAVIEACNAEFDGEGEPAAAEEDALAGL